jgi:protocatechuate 3,4-dioxygenase beta subunit
VLDEANEPIAGVRVMAMRSAYFEGQRRLVPAQTQLAITDDAGQYRLLGLTPGSYYVEAETRETWTVTEQGIERVMGYAKTFYPGATAVNLAGRITVGISQDMSNIDLAMVPGRAADVSGMVLDSQGRPLSGRQVQVVQDFRGPGGMRMVNLQQATSTAADGSFRIRNLSPGDYKLQVQNPTDVGGVSVQETAAALVTVDGVDIDNVSLITSAGWSVTGRVVADSGDAPAVDPARFRILARPLSDEASPVGPPNGLNRTGGRLRDDWTFTIPALHGPVRLRLDAPDDWAIKTILQNGTDVTDRVFDLRGGDTLGNLQVVITNQVNTVAGVLTDDRGAPTTDGTIIVFANDADKWAEDSRFVRSARPDQQGKFQIKGLPAGDYLAVAIDYVEEGMWNDPEYLESVRRYGEKVRLTESGSHMVTLKLRSP